MKVLILKSDDWEGLFIDGKLHDEGHVLGEGKSGTYLLEKAEELGFKFSDVKEVYLDDDDLGVLDKLGCFPSRLDELSGKYDNLKIVR